MKPAKRVVVTGMGIVSSIGNNTAEVLESLRTATPGIVFAQEYADLNFRCQVHGAPKLDPFEVLDRRTTRFMGKGAAWNYLAMQQAISGYAAELRREHGVEGRVEGDADHAVVLAVVDLVRRADGGRGPAPFPVEIQSEPPDPPHLVGDVGDRIARVTRSGRRGKRRQNGFLDLVARERCSRERREASVDPQRGGRPRHEQEVAAAPLHERLEPPLQARGAAAARLGGAVGIQLPDELV